MKNEKLSFDAFEALSENAEGKLVSGFSPAFEGRELIGGDDGTNIVCPILSNTNCPTCSGGSSKS
ncbi:hypothetical protein [Chitinophaga sp.]|uniref:hypothetical protein n=1 Tax=Chitinophaga sp. TaxID=1869181 RepID=UPI0031E338DA